MSTPLYTPAVLRLAASIPHHSRLANPHASADLRSPVCGSRVIADVMVDGEGRVNALGLDVRACALGQASAALMGQHVIGTTHAQIVEARVALSAFLSGDRDDPGAWPGLDIFAAARPHRARHASILLAFDAAAQAVAEAMRVAA